MYSRPSSSVRRAPRPERKKSGVPPTARKARTGEFTPPGMRACERSKRLRLRSYIGSSGSREVVEACDAARGCANVGGVEDGGNDGEHVGARLGRGMGVACVNAADRGDRQPAGGRARLLDQGERRTHRAWLGGRG